MPGSAPFILSVFLLNGRRLAATIPVYDHASVVLFHADRTRATELMSHPNICIVGTRKRICALRFEGPDPARLTGGSHHRRPVGTPHRHDNYFNVRGVWHLDRIPGTFRQYFMALIPELSR